MRIYYKQGDFPVRILYDINAPKKPTNLTVNSDLLKQAKEMKINISSFLEKSLAEELNKKKEELWKQENSSSIKEYNKYISENGLFSDGLRSI